MSRTQHIRRALARMIHRTAAVDGQPTDPYAAAQRLARRQAAIRRSLADVRADQQHGRHTAGGAR